MLSVHLNIFRTSARKSFPKFLRNLVQLREFPQKNSLFSQKFLTNDNPSLIPRCRYSTETFASKDPDVFGDIAGEEYEALPLDEDEQEQEKFEKNEARIPRRLKPSAGQYAQMIKEQIGKGDLDAALKILDLVQENRDKPTRYMYTLLLRAFAVQGDLKRVWKLYTRMKKRGIVVNGAAYCSVLNACANYRGSSQLALDRLSDTRSDIMQKKFVMKEEHYNVLVKAYGRHNRLIEAFKVVDFMIDKKMTIGEQTFNSLLYASISEKENGLRHALVVWHMMKRWGKKPDLITYNLLLRAIRDTKLGELKSNDVLIPNLEATRIVISDSISPDLLANPPILSEVSLPVQNRGEAELTSRAPSVASSELVVRDKLENVDLEEIHQQNKLILFGGFNGFLQRMEQDGVVPDTRTITLMLDVVPNSFAVEEKLIDTARTKKIPLDIDFFNMLIKRRCFRKDYKNAKNVLDHIQRHNLVPDIITWGVMALGCRDLNEANTLLDGMELSGHPLNPVIAGTLIAKGCASNQLPYILEIMRQMIKERVRPTDHVYTILDKFKARIEDTLKNDRTSKLAKNERFRQHFSTFKNKYEKFQAKFGRDENHAHIKNK